MHELTIAHNILEIAVNHAQQAGAARITAIHLVIGDLSSIVDDSVAFYWDAISENTIAEGAQLHFERIPAELECRDCGREYQLAKHGLCCPGCDGANAAVITGEEFYLDWIDIETPDQERSGPIKKPAKQMENA